MKLLKAFVLGLALWGMAGQSQAQIIGQPYYYHYGYGINAYGWGYTPIINGLWYWPYYGLAFPTWTTWGYHYYYDLPVYRFAAISYSPSTGLWGAAWGSYDRDDAAYNSIRFCRAEDCEPTVWVANGCAAVAVGSANNTVGWAYAYQRYSARSYALRSCRRSGGVGCEVLAWACSG